MFEYLRLDISRVSNTSPQDIPCPLCLTPMSLEWIDLPEPRVTKEHIIPDELGGTTTTLTCKDCNNNHGTQLDSHLIQMIRCTDSLSGDGIRLLSGRLGLAGKRVPVDIDWKVPTGTTEFKMRPNDPALPAQIHQFMSKEPDTIEIEVNLKYIPCRASLAILRIAYLAMFKCMGYSYILSPAADRVRQTIINYQKPPAEVDGVILRGISPAPTQPLEIHRIRNGDMFLVLMALVADSKRHHYAVPMPGPNIDPRNVLSTLCEAAVSLIRKGSG